MNIYLSSLCTSTHFLGTAMQKTRVAVLAGAPAEN
jgi:hypothetical protein